LQWEAALQDRPETTEPAFGDGDDRVLARKSKRTWRTPEIITFVPAREAEGIFLRPGDGIANLC
jgi:hypothetical protein